MTTAYAPTVASASDTISVTWTIDVGKGARPADLGQTFLDLEQVVALGERWGAMAARSGRTFAYGNVVVTTKVRDQGQEFERRLDLTPTVIHAANYQNPLIVVLGAAGLTVTGILKVLSMIRDWGPTRRKAAAEAAEAEANARIRATAANVAEWLASEARGDRLYLSVSEMVAAVGLAELQAIDRLSQHETQIDVPDDLAELDTQPH